MMPVHILRVFINSDGEFGDRSSVVVDEGRRISEAERQTLTKQLNTVETAFINDSSSADISIVHAQGELDFAGVPALGAAWLLAKLASKPVKTMKSRGGNIVVSQDNELTWIRADLATMPPWSHKQLASAAEVDRIILGETTSWKHTMAWAWIDEAQGLIRARTFATDWEIPEAEGNGSGAALLCASIQRAIRIIHGKGSEIFAKPEANSYIDIGGRILENPL